MTESSAITTSREQQRNQTRAQILDAAVTLFARAGFDAASLADIAAAAGVKKALVQYHFATKDKLWKAAAAKLWDERNAHMAGYLSGEAGADPLAQMRGGFTALVRFTRRNPQWLWFMFHEGSADTERSHWLIDNCLREDYRLGETFVREFQNQGLIRDGRPQMLLHLISGALIYNLLVAPATLQATGIDLASEQSIDEQVALLQELLAPG